MHTKIDILKVPHHGSSSSSTRELLATLRPNVAVISSGRKNKYGFPHKQPLENLKRYSHTIYNTQNQGAIMYTATRFGEKWETMVPDLP